MKMILVLLFVFLIALILNGHASPIDLANVSRVLACGSCSETQYCASPNTCVDASLAKAYTNDPGSAIGPYDLFKIIMVSDIQYDYVFCKQEPKDDCVFNAIVNSPKSDRVAALETAVNKQVTCIDTLPLSTYSMIIDGGDLTNKGLFVEYTKYLDFYEKMKGNGAGLHAQLPMMLTLGNHDYYTKGTSKTDPDRAAWMLSFLKTTIDNFPSSTDAKLLSVDISTGSHFDLDFADDVLFYEGSFMYSVEVKGIVFIFMHWAPSILGNGVYTNSFTVDSALTMSGQPEKYSITNGRVWFKEQVRTSNLNGKKVILVPHYVEALVNYIESAGTTAETFVSNNVMAVLTGHDHDQWGEYGRYVVDEARTYRTDEINAATPAGIPVYYAGSASYEKFITAEIHNDGGSGTITVQPYSSSTCATVTPDFKETI